MLIPEAYGGAGQTLLEARDRLRGARPRARADAALRERRARRGRAAARRAATRRSSAWLPRIATGEAILTPAWLEPERGFGPNGVQLAATRRRRRLRLTRHQAARAVRARGHAAARARAHGRRPSATSTCSSSIRARRASRSRSSAASRLGHASTGSSSTDVRVPASARASAPPARAGRPGSAVMHDAIVLLAAQAMGGAERALEITVEYAKDAQAVRQAARRLPGDLALPGRRRRPRVDGGKTLVYEAAWARATGRGDRAARADGEALRLPDLPRRHGDVPAGLGRRRLHDRVRHPALLPPREAAPALVVGHARTSRSWSRRGARHRRAHGER